VAFVLFSLLVGLWLTFPYDELQDMLKDQADSAGLYVKMQSFGPGLFPPGISASNVQISKKSTAADTKPPEALVIKSITLRPSLFPLGVHVSANALGGSLSATVGGISELALDVSA